jgi:CheY-like chemotaxis protein
MDMRMPIVDGYEATREIRSWPDPYYQNLPIIALTASAMQDQRDKMIALGVTEYIPKPFNPEQLYKTIAVYKNMTKSGTLPVKVEEATFEMVGESEPDIPNMGAQVEQFARLVDELEQGLDKESEDLQDTITGLKSCLINLNLDRYLGRLDSTDQNSLNLVNTLKAELFSLKRMV